MPTRRQLLAQAMLASTFPRFCTPVIGQETTLGNGQEAAQAESPQAWLQRHLSDWQRRYNLPGISCALMLNEQIVAEAAAGVRKWGDPTPLLFDDAQQIGSITKPITAALTAKMIERGVLSWDTTLQDVFPEMVPFMVPEYRRVSVQLLLAHLSGMPYKPLTEPENAYADLPLIAGRYEYVRAAVQDQPQAPVGTGFIYGGGPIIVAAMMERLTGRTWEDLVSQEIFGPLAMATARFGAEPQDNPTGARVAWEHTMQNRTPVPIQPAGQFGLSFARTHGPAGSINCSPSDLLNFMACYFPDERGATPFFSADSYKTLTTLVNGIKGPGWGIGAVAPETNRTLELAHGGSNGRNLAGAVLWPIARSGYVWAVNTAGDLSVFQNEIDGLLRRAATTGRCVDPPQFTIAIDKAVTGLTAEWWQYQILTEGYIPPQHTFVLRPDDLKNRLCVSAPWSDGHFVFDSGDYPQGGRLEYKLDASTFGTWQHFAVVVNHGTKEMKVYRNGREEAAKSSGGFLRPGQYLLCLEGDAWPFPGQIREFRLWSNVRSPAQIQSQMRQAADPKDGGLLAYHKGYKGQLSIP